jgi:hypothetical protein
MFNPQILAASWVEKMVSLYPNVVEQWMAIPEEHPKLAIMRELDHFIEETVERMAAHDKTNPDLWGQAMTEVLETQYGESMELDPREMDLKDRVYLQDLREHLNAMVDHYFEADWEKEADQNSSQ